MSNKQLKGEDYIRVSEDTLITRREILKGKTWNKNHFALAEEGLFMPPPNLFMLHYSKVRDAAQGKLILYDGNKDAILRVEAEDIWNSLSSQYRGGCWTWLDAKFKKINGVLHINYNHGFVDGELQPQKTEKLEDCVNEDCFVDLIFNNQGLPIQKSKKQKYQQGNNIYFYHPKNGSVARFFAGLGGAVLDCYGDPGDSGPAIGVFAVCKR